MRSARTGARVQCLRQRLSSHGRLVMRGSISWHGRRGAAGQGGGIGWLDGRAHPDNASGAQEQMSACTSISFVVRIRVCVEQRRCCGCLCGCGCDGSARHDGVVAAAVRCWSTLDAASFQRATAGSGSVPLGTAAAAESERRLRTGRDREQTRSAAEAAARRSEKR